jgi:hypothetical protein
VRGAAVFRLIIGAGVAGGVLFLLYEPVLRPLSTFAFSGAQSTHDYGFALAIPYVTLAAPLGFLIVTPVLAWVALRKLPPLVAEPAAGAIGWSLLSLFVLASVLVSPPFGVTHSAALTFTAGFVLFQAVIGAVGGFVMWALRALFAR